MTTAMSRVTEATIAAIRNGMAILITIGKSTEVI
jgi:hypothetical protein